MATTLEEIKNSLLSQTGFLGPSGQVASGLIDPDAARRRPETDLRYSRLFAAMESDPSYPDVVYESPNAGPIPGTPCGYIKVLTEYSQERVADMRQRLWNHGRIPTLWVITPEHIRIYDAFARPLETEQVDHREHLLHELGNIASRLNDVSQIHKRNFDDGSFWHTGYGRRINARQRVDQSLLRDLQETEVLLRDYRLSPSSAHALLCQTVFIKYLEDRGILRPHDFGAHGNAGNFQELLTDFTGTSTLFEWLEDKFNGDLFAQPRRVLDGANQLHLDIIRRFLSGHSMKGYPNTQSRLWPYSFQIIPIELISSIYEMFAHSGNPATARARSVHYTRLGLVSTVLSLAMQEIPSSGRILDPACGSGVFLVEAFRRLAWSKAQQLGRPLTSSELREILTSQIFGMDIDKDAVYVTAFSLSLALLEMEQNTGQPPQFKLPNLMGGGLNHQSQNLYIQDFFNSEHQFNSIPPFGNRGFDLVVSNPPWTALKKKDAPKDPDHPTNGRQWGWEYAVKHRVPNRKPDQAFMLRAREFASAKTKIAMVIASRMFHQTSSTGRKWRNDFLETNTLHTVIDMSDLATEKLLFGGTRSPRFSGSVVIFSPQSPRTDSSFQHIAPKWYRGVRQRDELLVTGADTRQLLQEQARQDSFWWKSAARGLPRDMRLLDRFASLKTLAQVLDETGIRSGAGRGRGISLGGNPERDVPHLQGIPYLSGQREKRRFSLNVKDLPQFSEPKVATRSTHLTLELPALAVSRALVNRRPGVCLIEPYGDLTKLVVDQSYYGISFSGDRPWLARRVNAILNSELTLYWIFMTGADVGVGVRNLIESTDWFGVPMPLNILDQDNLAWADVLSLEHALSQTHNRDVDILDLQEALDQAVYQLYGLSDQDLVQMRDTVLYTFDPFLSRSQSTEIEPPSGQLLNDYARRVCAQLNDILRFAENEISATICNFSRDTPLQACRFTTRPAIGETSVDNILLQDSDALLAQISEHLRYEVADNLFIQRDLRVYDGSSLWIIKPAEDRLWTEAAALRDADLVVAEHLGL